MSRLLTLLRKPSISAFTPASISNLALWLDASDLASITDAGAGSVSQWADKSGLGNHATQVSSGLRPSTGTRTLNGKNVIDFDRTATQYLDLPSGLYGVSAGPCTVIIVGSSDGAASNYRFYNGSVSGITCVTARYGSPTAFSVQNRTSSGLTQQTITRDTGAHILGFRRSGTSITPFFDGVLGSAGSNAQDVTVTALGLGRDPASTTDNLDGPLAEILVYSKLR